MLRSCGKYSYGMYVLHMPIVIFLSIPLAYLFGAIHLHSSSGRVAIAIAVGTGLTYLVALVSWNLLENPLLRLKSRFPVTEFSLPAIEGKPR